MKNLDYLWNALSLELNFIFVKITHMEDDIIIIIKDENERRKNVGCSSEKLIQIDTAGFKNSEMIWSSRV